MGKSILQVRWNQIGKRVQAKRLMDMKKIIQQSAFILVLSIVIGLSVNVSMIRRSIKGEFSQG